MRGNTFILKDVALEVNSYAGNTLISRIQRILKALWPSKQLVDLLKQAVEPKRLVGRQLAVIIHMVVNTLGIADGRNFLNYSYPNLRPSTHLFKSETRCKDWTSWLVSAQKSKN